MDFSQFVEGNALVIRLTSVNVNELIKFLQDNGNISTLILHANGINAEDIEALANGNLVNLTRLDFVGNKIGDEGAEALANGNLVNLTRLDLSRNRITNKGLEALDKKVSDFISINLLWNKINILPFYVHKVTATVAPFACLLLLSLGVASFTGAVNSYWLLSSQHFL